MKKNIIAWDLGATKCAAGLVEYDKETHHLTCKKKTTIKLLETHSLTDLIEQLESGLEIKMSDADAVCIGAAGQYDGKHLLLEGVYPYIMPFSDIARTREWPAYDVIHDYAPIVCATFTTYMDDARNVKRLNTCAMKTEGRRVALGMGTGLGLKDGVLLPNGDFWLGKNEIGHIGITTPPHAENVALAFHRELMDFFHEKMPDSYPLTFEKLLSGQGTVRLYQFLYPSQQFITPEEVGIKMRAGEVPELMDAFAWYAGLFVGTVQLTFMPEGGVWITGGVALNHVDIFDRPAFNEGIKASPAYSQQREQYPLGILCNHEHALIGGGYYATKRLIQYQTKQVIEAYI